MSKSNSLWFAFPLMASLVVGACQAVDVREHGSLAGVPGHGHAFAGSADKGSEIDAEVLELSAGVKLNQIIPKIADKRVVYVGETHDRYSHHLVQLEIVRRLHRLNPDIAIGMEFFQQPFQKYLDAYITGETNQQQMLADTEWYDRWVYDFRLYQPLLDYARQNRIPVVALNLSREMVKRVSGVGIEGLTPEERAAIPAVIDDSDEAYRGRLRDVFRQHGKSGGKDFDRFVQVQLLWDESMAERVARYLADNPQTQMVVLAGSGHLMYGAGIPNRVERRQAIEGAILLPGDTLKVQPGIADYIVYPETAQLPKAGRMGVLLGEAEEGVKVERVGAGTAGERAGLKRDDIIQRLDGSTVHDSSDIKIAMLEKSPGDRIKLQVLRKRVLWGEEQLEFDFELGE